MESQEKSNLLSFEVSARALKMLRCYHLISELDAAQINTELGALVSATIERELARRIKRDLRDLVQDEQENSGPRVSASLPDAVFEDTTGISDGLGDVDETPDEPEPEPEEIPPVSGDAEAFVPTGGGGVTDEALNNDLAIKDPHLEAAAEAPLSPNDDAEQLLNQAVQEFVDPRIARRRRGKKSGSRGKAVPFNGVEKNEL